MADLSPRKSEPIILKFTPAVVNSFGYGFPDRFTGYNMCWIQGAGFGILIGVPRGVYYDQKCTKKIYTPEYSNPDRL